MAGALVLTAPLALHRLEVSLHLRSDSIFAHQPLDGRSTTPIAERSKLLENSRAPIGPIARPMDVFDRSQQLLPSDRGGPLATTPVSVSAARDFEHASHFLNGKLVTMVFHEGVFHFGTSMKYAMAFFSMSRSIVTFFSFFSSWWSRSSSGLSFPLPGRSTTRSTTTWDRSRQSDFGLGTVSCRCGSAGSAAAAASG